MVDVHHRVAAGARGRGVATRALTLIAGARAQPGLEELRLWTHAADTGSQRVTERALQGEQPPAVRRAHRPDPTATTAPP